MPMTSQEMIKLLLKTVLLLSARTAPMLPLQRHKKGLEQAILKQAGLK